MPGQAKPPLSGSASGASSSIVRLQLTASSEPPASEKKVAFCPPGETSSMSMSSGYVWLSPVRSRFTSVIAPVMPETTHVEGYGVAGPASLIVIEPPVQLADGAFGAVAAEVRRGAPAALPGFVPAAAFTARTRPKSKVPVARTEKSVARRPNGRAVVISPPQTLG